MNKTGKMTALKLTYNNARQFQMGQPQRRNRQLKSAYQ